MFVFNATFFTAYKLVEKYWLTKPADLLVTMVMLQSYFTYQKFNVNINLTFPSKLSVERYVYYSVLHQ